MGARTTQRKWACVDTGVTKLYRFALYWLKTTSIAKAIWTWVPILKQQFDWLIDGLIKTMNCLNVSYKNSELYEMSGI